jgi:hypothetical protein
LLWIQMQSRWSTELSWGKPTDQRTDKHTTPRLNRPKLLRLSLMLEVPLLVMVS